MIFDTIFTKVLEIVIIYKKMAQRTKLPKQNSLKHKDKQNSTLGKHIV